MPRIRTTRLSRAALLFLRVYLLVALTLLVARFFWHR